MAVIAGTTRIARPPEVVFDFLADPRHEPAYNSVVMTADKVTPGSIGPGTRYRQTIRSVGRPRPVDIQLLEYDRPRRLRWHITSAGMDVRGEIAVRGAREGSVVTWAWRFRPRGWVRLVGPLAVLLGARLERGVWRRLKAHLETSDRLDEKVDGHHPQPSRSVDAAGASGVKGLLGRVFPPQDYSAPRGYRPPAGWYRRLNRIGVPLTSLGLAPRDAVTLKVRGRRSGRPRCTPVLVTEYGGSRYLVALAGESHWVRNVRASGGHATLRRRGTRRVRLEELPVPERAPILAAYVAAGHRRSGAAAAREAARANFGHEDPTSQQLRQIADRYPVFRVHEQPAELAEIANGVFCLGPWGRSQTNAYAVRTESSWVLVDTGWARDADRIRRATDTLFGGEPPTAILLTHAHPDHSGAALRLARGWNCPVYLHPAELPVATGDYAAITRVAGPLDRWVVLPLLRVVGRRRREAIVAAGSLTGVASSFSPAGPVPALPGWEVIPTPGHTPGHVSLYRAVDRVLISGDALVTLRLNDVVGLLTGRPGLCGPPWYTTWNRAAARDSIRRLADLGPAVLAGGHGHPLTGPGTAAQVRAFVRGHR